MKTLKKVISNLLMFTLLFFITSFGFKHNLKADEIGCIKIKLVSGCIGTRTIGGINYTFSASIAQPTIVNQVRWSGGNTTVGNYGFTYNNSNNIYCANVAFTGPNGAVSYNGPILGCND